MQCAAVTGGSKRDVEKLVARTQHRRPRHLKGMTPSKIDLLEELEEEEEAEEDVENEVTQLVSEDITSTAAENVSEDSGGEGQLRRDLLADNTFEGMNDRESEDLSGVSEAYVGDATSSPTDSHVKNVVNDAAVGAKAILETTENIVTDVVDTAADTQKQVVSNAMKGGESLVGGINDAANKQSTRPSFNLKARADEARDSTEAIADVTADTASDIGNMINETGQQVRQDMAASASSIGEVLDSQTNNAINGFGEQANEAEASVNAVADVVRDTTEYVNRKVSETGKQLGQDLAEVASTGQSLFEDGSQVMSQQAKELTSQAEKFLDEEGSLLEQGAARIQNEASKSLDRVQDSVQKSVQESARAARSVGMEALGMGELLVDTAKETIQATAFTENRRSKSGGASKNGSLTLESQPQVSQQEDLSRFAGFKVLVAGASGQTGRLIVENLLSKGVSVQALVRDAYKARSIQQLKDCECIEADLYKYETVKKAIGDCNVVICAIGARAFPLDPFSTYQVEYEGVLNLISAAKNQGKVKKFILISTIGVTYLQLVLLLFWKKQAELYLQRSGLDYTIVRPGGLRNTNEPEEVVMQGADSQFFGGISRKKVAEICVSALTSSDASDKVVEVVSVPGPQRSSINDLFKLV